jgi:hypothetical protein
MRNGTDMGLKCGTDMGLKCGTERIWGSNAERNEYEVKT